MLTKKQELVKLYGFYDCNNASLSVFSDKGVKVSQKNCLKVSFQINSKTVGGLYVPVDDNFKLSDCQKEFRKAMKEITSAAGESVPQEASATVEDRIVKGEHRVKFTGSSSSQSLQAVEDTACITATLKNDYDKILAGMNPNDPIRPEIQGLCDAVIPNVKSWKDLISNFTVPRPTVWLCPVFGDSIKTCSGGVSTRDFPVRREALEERVTERRGEVRDNYCRIGRTMSVRAQVVVAQGMVYILNLQ